MTVAEKKAKAERLFDEIIAEHPDFNFEEYQERVLCSQDIEWDGSDAPCEAQTDRSFAYDYQTYALFFDGTCYNEICEFTFDDDGRGHGYYYQFNRM